MSLTQPQIITSGMYVVDDAHRRRDEQTRVHVAEASTPMPTTLHRAVTTVLTRLENEEKRRHYMYAHRVEGSSSNIQCHRSRPADTCTRHHIELHQNETEVHLLYHHCSARRHFLQDSSTAKPCHHRSLGPTKHSVHQEYHDSSSGNDHSTSQRSQLPTQQRRWCNLQAHLAV
jgi:hypothetical protein